jgi:hypothetical protein
MLKKYISHSWIILTACLIIFVGCYKDKGNYSYEKNNGLTIKDIKSATRIFISPGDTLKLSPEITQTISGDSLNYLWFVYDNSANVSYTLPKDTIAVTKNLNYIIDPSVFVLGESYRLTGKVTDSKTGISSFIFYDLTISNKYSSGWMFFEETPTGTADFSMILSDNSVVHNLYSLINPSAPLLGKPVAITSTSFDITDDISGPGKRIYLLTENNGIELNALTLQKKFPLDYLFFAPPTPEKPTFIGWTAYLYGSGLFQRMGVAVNNGKVYVNLVGGFPGIKKWGNALATPNADFDYEMSPDIAGGNSYSSTYPIVMYDTKHKRFYSVGTTSLAAFPATASTVFDMNNVGLDLLKLDSSNVSGTSNAVMNNTATGTPYLLQFKTKASAADPVITVANVAMNAPGIINSKAITASTLTPHIYYASGNTIVKYETTSNTVVNQYSFPGSEMISKMEYVKNAPDLSGARLVVVTWNGTESKVYYFSISTLGDLSTTYTNMFTGFAKIVDLAYKFP